MRRAPRRNGGADAGAWRYGRAIATWTDVERIALALPETVSGTTFRAEAWKVEARPKPRTFAWKRPLSERDEKQLAELGREIPTGEILGLRAESMHHKEALLEELPDVIFTIPHFDGYSGVLCRLDTIDLDLLEDLIVEAWLGQAPKLLVEAYVAEHGGPEAPRPGH